jgi:uncharacterized protein DUF4158
MSSVSEPLVPTSVLRYTAMGPAVPLPSHPSDEELAFDWTLSERDIRLILTRRGPENLCRFAVQLGPAGACEQKPTVLTSALRRGSRRYSTVAGPTRRRPGSFSEPLPLT